jgi:hypothetical protein
MTDDGYNRVWRCCLWIILENNQRLYTKHRLTASQCASEESLHVHPTLGGYFIYCLNYCC